MMGTDLAIQERDIVVIVDGYLNTAAQCAAVKEANTKLGIIRRGTEKEL